MFVKIYPENPQPRFVKQAADILRDGGIIIYPTDSVYALACAISQIHAIERMEQVKGFYTNAMRLSVVCESISQAANYLKPIDNNVFKVMKRNLPGPFTFILEANSTVPKIFKGKKKTIGIRVPDNNIAISIIQELGEPLVSTSLPYMDEEPEYACSPEFINERFSRLADMIIDGGEGGSIPSAIVDCTSGEMEIVREGAVELIL